MDRSHFAVTERVDEQHHSHIHTQFGPSRSHSVDEMFVEGQEVVVQVVEVGGHNQLERTAPVVAVPLSHTGIDFVEIGFVSAEGNVEIGSDLVEVKWDVTGCANVCLGCTGHMVRTFQELSCRDQLFGVVVEGNIPRW